LLTIFFRKNPFQGIKCYCLTSIGIRPPACRRQEGFFTQPSPTGNGLLYPFSEISTLSLDRKRELNLKLI
jgi:hypothetical protein